MDKTTTKDRILNHLEKYGKITSWEAIELYGCTRISEYISQLRKEDYCIETVWTKGKNRYGQNVRYGIYKLIKN